MLMSFPVCCQPPAYFFRLPHENYIIWPILPSLGLITANCNLKLLTAAFTAVNTHDAHLPNLGCQISRP